MRIDLSSAPHQVDDLLRFLRMTGYLADEVDYAIIEVDVDAVPASALGVPAMALALRLRVWNEVNNAEARLLEANLPYEPLEPDREAHPRAPRIRWRLRRLDELGRLEPEPVS